MRLLGNLDRFQETHRDFLGVLLRHLANPDRRQRAVFENGQVREQIEMLEHHPDLAPDIFDVLQVAVQFDPMDVDDTLLVDFKPVEAPDEGRFAGTRRPADDDPLTLVHLEIDIAKHMEVAVPLVDRVHGDDDLVANGHLRTINCVVLSHCFVS